MKLSTDNTNDSSTKYTYTIDFLVPYGSHGGIESVLNDTALSLLQQNIRVREYSLAKPATAGFILILNSILYPKAPL